MTYDVVLPTLFQYQRPLTCVPFSFELGHDLTRNAAPIQIQVIQVHVDFEGFSMAFPHPKPTCFSTSTERPKVWMENCRAAVLRRLGKLGNVSILENSRDLRWKKRGHSDHDIPWPMTLWRFVKTQTPTQKQIRKLLGMLGLLDIYGWSSSLHLTKNGISMGIDPKPCHCCDIF